MDDQLTCADIESAGEAAGAIGADMLKTLTADDFIDCADLLGDIDTWSNAQLVELGILAKNVSSNYHRITDKYTLLRSS